MARQSTSSESAIVQEIPIRLMKNEKRYDIMKFNKSLSVDFNKWRKITMKRENVKGEKRAREDQPKFGGGTVFGREAKEEARRRKKMADQAVKDSKAEGQPWILQSDEGKTLKGTKVGGVSDNAAYYVFTQMGNGQLQAFKLDDWYAFRQIETFRSLSAEEAEKLYMKRDNNLNFHSLMLKKRLENEQTELEEGEEKTKEKSLKKGKELKISEMDEWMTSSSDGDSSCEEEADESDNKVKKSGPKKPRKKRDVDLEAFEDSDDGDEEGRELDYISDSTDSEPEDNKLEGVAEEKALKKLLNSDDESDDESDEEKTEKDMQESIEAGEAKIESREEEDANKKKTARKDKHSKKYLSKPPKSNSIDDILSSESDKKSRKRKRDIKEKTDKKQDAEKVPDKAQYTQSVRAKEKMDTSAVPQPVLKKPRLEEPVVSTSHGGSAITEEAVKKYLRRKPITTTELLHMFNSKNLGLPSNQIVSCITKILVRLNPVRQTVNGKLYLSLE